MLAQLVEQRTFNPFVVGSTPAHPTKLLKALCNSLQSAFSLNDSFQESGMLAQLVEQRTFNPFVVGSTPAHPTNIKKSTLYLFTKCFFY